MSARRARSDRYGCLFRIGLWASSAGVRGLAGALITGVGSPPLAARNLVSLLLIPVTRWDDAVFDRSRKTTGRAETASVITPSRLPWPRL